MTISAPRFRVLLIQLIAAQACYYMIVSADLTLTGLVGLSLAPSPALTTLPLSLIVVVGTACSFIAGNAASRYGYRPVMIAGAACAVAGGALSAVAVGTHSFALFCVGTALTGGYRAVGGFLRFIASEYAPPARRERALALVLYGGIVAAVLGPVAAVAASTAWSRPYVGSCLLIAALGLAAAVLARTLPPAQRSMDQTAVEAVRIRDRLGHPKFRQALLVLAGSGLVMTLVMAAGPLAGHHAGHSSAMGAAMIQWHLVGMFAPSALSAWALRRLGTGKTVAIGLAVMAGGCALGAVGVAAWAMVGSLALVGVGWNVLFVAGSALLLQCYPQGRGSRVQGFIEGATAGVSAIGSFAAADILMGAGWGGTSLLALAATAVLGALFAILWRRKVTQEKGLEAINA
ncbi:hypothetical protein AL755_02040 (plasmid) [Arthrobacter sp. ERGS1:01]|uniref:MFS transporter n=1 Tax=Arthrobacter sp. ERGS1:01 TaxID=1704044 RepID=UPI0006B54965|nr:MFS transporter [Arthrobacter sp. ERGS1:01]ALE04481.1 hypothetical protein AL755_02040 [Arthrobacter sp. ERGS1:01]